MVKMMRILFMIIDIDLEQEFRVAYKWGTV